MDFDNRSLAEERANTEQTCLELGRIFALKTNRC